MESHFLHSEGMQIGKKSLGSRAKRGYFQVSERRLACHRASGVKSLGCKAFFGFNVWGSGLGFGAPNMIMLGSIS